MQNARRYVLALAVMACPAVVFAQTTASTSTVQIKDVLHDTTTATVINPGEVRHQLALGTAGLMSIATPSSACVATSPAGCAEAAAIGGFADTSTAWSADRLDGRVVVVRNVGPGVLALKAEDPDASAEWRIAQPFVIGAGEFAVLVYDASTARWQVLNTMRKLGGSVK